MEAARFAIPVITDAVITLNIDGIGDLPYGALDAIQNRLDGVIEKLDLSKPIDLRMGVQDVVVLATASEAAVAELPECRPAETVEATQVETQPEPRKRRSRKTDEPAQVEATTVEIEPETAESPVIEEEQAAIEAEEAAQVEQPEAATQPQSEQPPQSFTPGAIRNEGQRFWRKPELQKEGNEYPIFTVTKVGKDFVNDDQGNVRTFKALDEHYEELPPVEVVPAESVTVSNLTGAAPIDEMFSGATEDNTPVPGDEDMPPAEECEASSESLSTMDLGDDPFGPGESSPVIAQSFEVDPFADDDTSTGVPLSVRVISGEVKQIQHTTNHRVFTIGEESTAINIACYYNGSKMMDISPSQCNQLFVAVEHVPAEEAN